ncbi:MAG: dihydrolipoyl dehydrogenase [Spirochaetia bacterium]|nr:dihydrolipoyl dehydrogenase [Spirochaetia bacterium]
MEIYDLIVVGAGPGGYVAAERAGELGKKVLLIEKEHMGGVCTNSGCIPTKSLLNAAKHFVHAEEGAKYGVVCSGVKFDLTTAMAWKQDTIETLRKGIQYLMKKSGVTVVSGTAEFLDTSHISVGDTVYEGKNILIATGSSTVVPPIKGVDSPIVTTSREILEIESMPEKLAVIGGGVIGVEFASFFSSAGAEVTVIEMMPEIVPLMETEFSKLLRREMKKVTFKLGCRVYEITDTGVNYTDAKGVNQTVEADTVLISVGRKPNVDGLEKLKTTQGFGLDYSKYGIAVNEKMQTNLPNVYAVGDVTGKSLLAHSASRMGEVAVANMFGKGALMRYDAIPWVVYSLPEASGCGMTEEEAKKAGYQVVSASMQMRANGRFLAEFGKKAGGLCKVIADAGSGRILGIHLLGGAGSEMIFGAAAFIEAELRVQDIREIIFPHPTISEIIKDVCIAIELPNQGETDA